MNQRGEYAPIGINAKSNPLNFSPISIEKVVWVCIHDDISLFFMCLTFESRAKRKRIQVLGVILLVWSGTFRKGAISCITSNVQYDHMLPPFFGWIYPPKNTFPFTIFPSTKPSRHQEAQSVLFRSNNPLPLKCWQGVHVNRTCAVTWPFACLWSTDVSHQSSSITRSWPCLSRGLSRLNHCLFPRGT